MDSAMIAKISKAREYAQEPERMTLIGVSVAFLGKHQAYEVKYERGLWHCACDFFAQRGVCSHTMAVEKVLQGTGMVFSSVEAAAPERAE
jgi:hypothetical protein